MATKDPKVFVSSTGLDLEEYRAAAMKVCDQLDLHIVAMENFEAMGLGATEASLAKLDDASVYVGIFALRYGYIEDGYDRSVTELEFDHAGTLSIERLCFLLDPKARWPLELMDIGGLQKLDEFKKRIDKSLIRAQFQSVDGFEKHLFRSLLAWKQRQGDEQSPSAELSQAHEWHGNPHVRDYLSKLWSRLQPLPLYAIKEGGSKDDCNLSAVYTALDITETVHARKDAQPEWEKGWSVQLSGFVAAMDGAYVHALEHRLVEEGLSLPPRQRRKPMSRQRRLSALEAVAGSRLLVLQGPPGGGKSTFARYLALSHAGEILGKEATCLARLNRVEEGKKAPAPEQLAWPHGPMIPLFVELRHLVESEAFQRGEEADAGIVLSLIQTQARSQKAEGFAEALAEILGKDGEGVFLLLDGLDETPSAAASRERLKAVVASWVLAYPACRVLVTSRPYAYREISPWRLDPQGFATTSLADLSKSQQGDFVRAWYEHLADRGHVQQQQANDKASHLEQEISRQGYLRPLANSPLMLTMLADLHASGSGRFQGGRAGVYAESVKLLLDRWNEARGLHSDDGGNKKTAAEALDMDLGSLREALEELAFEVHRSRGSEASEDKAAIEEHELWRVLKAHRPSPEERSVDESRVERYLHERSGILLDEGEGRYRFPHRSYQEYLAACYLSRDADFPDRVLEVAVADPTLWRETIAFVGARVPPSMLRDLMAELLSNRKPAATGQKHAHWWRVLLASLALESSGLWTRETWRKGPRLQRLRSWLLRALDVGALDPVDRAQLGRMLGWIGDPRPGVGLREDGLPDIDWVEIHGGEFLKGSREDESEARPAEQPQQAVEVAAFEISRYPVSYAQFRAFAAAGGYSESARELWSEEGWGWLESKGAPERSPQGNVMADNHPAVRVSWYEAEAYCAWLSRELGGEIRLPSDSEWEKAARGTAGQIYPWGDKFAASHCNSREGGVGQATAAGSYPSGASSYGVLDMSGNVFEWCATPCTFKDGEFAVSPGGSSRVIRGGGWNSPAQFCRAAYRFGFLPGGRDGGIGFRLARTCP